MSVYTRPDSPYYWLRLERPGQRPQRERTDILARGVPASLRRVNRQLAEERYHLRKTELAQARYAREEAARPAIRFRDFAQWYRRHVSATKRGAVREAEILDRLEKAFGERWIANVTRPAVQEWMTTRRADVAPATVNRELDVLKHLMASAVPLYLDRSPLTGLRRLRAPSTEPRLLARNEEARLLEVVSATDKAIIIMALDTLMRLSDIVNFKRSQDHGAWLTVVDPKVRQYRVPISTRLREALDALPLTGPYYFSSRRRAKATRDFRSSVRQMLQRACAKTEPPIPYGRPDGITFHGLRHTGATRMLEAGVNPRVVMKIGGWSSMRQLERYMHPSEALERQAVEAIGPAADTSGAREPEHASNL